MGKKCSNTKNVEHLSQLTNNITLHIVVYQQHIICHWNHNCKKILLMYQNLFLVDQILRSKPLKVKSSQQWCGKNKQNLTNNINLRIVDPLGQIIYHQKENCTGVLLKQRTNTYIKMRKKKYQDYCYWHWKLVEHWISSSLVILCVPGDLHHK